MKGLWAFLLAVVMALPSRAEVQPLAGQDTLEFQAALDLWLSGDEAQALPALAELVAAENRAAQVLVGLIDVTPQFQGRWLYALPRDQRVALMRAPSGGLSGKNWLREAGDEALAQAWVQMWDGNSGPDVMLAFARLGEQSAARTAAKRLARREAKGFGPMADDPDFPAFAIGLAIKEWRATDPARAQMAQDGLHPADPVRALLGPYEPDPSALLALADSDPALRLLDQHLGVLCADDPAGRAGRLVAALDLLGGWWGLANLGPPAEVLVNPDRWAASAQGSAAFVRLLPDPDPKDAAAMDPCLADLQRRAATERGTLK